MTITNGYLTAAELKTATSGGITGTGSDADIERAIEAASRAIEKFCRRRFWQDTQVVDRYYTATPASAHRRNFVGAFGEVIVDDISTTTGLVVATDPGDDGTYEVTWTRDTDFRLWPINAAADGVPWTVIERMQRGSYAFPYHEYRVKVTAKFGWAAVPTDVKQACLILSQRYFARRTSPFGVAGSNDQGVVRISREDVDVMNLLRPFRRVRVPNQRVSTVL